MLFGSLHRFLAISYWVRLYQDGPLAAKDTVDFLLAILLRIIAALLILLAARVVVSIVRRIVSHGITTAIVRSDHGQRRLTTLQGVLLSALTYSIYFTAVILILFTMGVTWKGLAPLLGAASVLGLAIGFGAQRLIRDVITGMFILGEGQFDVGDWVTIGTVSGRVEDIGLRITRVRDDQGRCYTVANGDITQVFNASRGLLRLPIEINLLRGPALDEALAQIREATDEILRTFAVAYAEHQAPAYIVTGMEAAKVTES